MKRKVIIPYKPKLKEVARKLRKSGTLSEVLLWTYLKKKKMRGYDFDRQKPIDNYIVDFFCNELMLAIEIDGCSHNEKSEEDRIRQAKLESLGVRFLRFYDADVKKNIQGVLWVIEDWIRKHKDEPTPTPPKRGILRGILPLLKGRNGRTKKMRGQRSLFSEEEVNEK